MKVKEAFLSKFLKAGDLQDRTVKLTIDRVEMDEVGDGRKPIAYFKDAKKGLVLNVTNARAIATLAGDDMDTWTGTQIELFSTPVTFKGQVTEGIRVRPIDQVHTKKSAPATTPAPNDLDPDDPIDL